MQIINYRLSRILLVFARRRTGLIAVYFFLSFSIGGGLTLAMLAGFGHAQGLCFTLKPGGGAVEVPGVVLWMV